jgi:hypothetical protein
MSLDDNHERLWPVLLDYIEEGTVVPVLGRDLLELETTDGNGGARSVLLYRVIAEELARQLDVPTGDDLLSGPNPLGAVASQHITLGRNPNIIYSALPIAVDRVVSSDPASGVVKLVHDGSVVRLQALRKLASIPNFRVFVTTTFDTLLSDCVAAVRDVAPKVMHYAPRSPGAEELANFQVGDTRDRTLKRLEQLERPVVVHILGRLTSTPNYVVTEEDAFEFVYSLQETRPEGLFDLLSQMRLLIVGCRFPSWLVRFFLRSARRRRLLQSALDRTDFVVDDTATEDASLVQFLQNFKTQTELFTRYRPTEFVDELSRRWQQRAARRNGSADVFAPCAVFLSYASENAETARCIARQLNEANLPVWFDRDHLASGDEWASKIKRHIEGAAAVVPLISRAAESSRSREFRKEWRHALDVKRGLPANEPFIYPVAVDDVACDSERIDPEIRALHWETLDGGRLLGPRTIEALKRAYRSAQLARSERL